MWEVVLWDGKSQGNFYFDGCIRYRETKHTTMTAVQNIVTSKHTYHVPVPPPLLTEGYTVSRNVANFLVSN